MGLSPFNLPPIAIIIVHWKGIHHSRACLESLLRISYPSYQIILVDNGSETKDGSILKSEFPGIQILFSNQNLGFTGGNNLGIASALAEGYEYVLLLNNDTLVEVDFLDLLVDELLANPRLGMVQPLIYFNSNRAIIWSAGGRFVPWLGMSKTVGYGKNREQANLSDNNTLDWATGCCMLIRASVLREVGLFQESFFAYFEDVDLSLRIRKMGHGIALVPASAIYHDVAGSSKNKSDEGTLSPTVFYLTARNQLFQIKLHAFGLFGKIPAWSFHLAKFFGWFIYFCLRGRRRKAQSLLRGIYDGCRFDPSVNRPMPPR